MGCECDKPEEKIEIIAKKYNNSSKMGDRLHQKEIYDFQNTDNYNPINSLPDSDIKTNKKNGNNYENEDDNNNSQNYDTENNDNDNNYYVDENDEKKEDKTKPSDLFSQYIYNHINELRQNPQSFIPIIENAKYNIMFDKHDRLIYKSNVKVALSTGREAFEEAISILSNTKSMDKLIYDSDIRVKLPKREDDIKNKNYLKTQILIMKDNGKDIKSYWRDIIKDAETSFILMIVDDTGKKAGLKRQDILNPNFKHIGICSTMINKSFVCYLTFN